GQPGPQQRKGRRHPGPRVRRSADHAEAPLGACIYLAEAQTIGIGVADGFDDFRNHHALESGLDLFEVLHDQAGGTQPIRDLGGGRAELHELTQPTQWQLHRRPPLTEGNCARNRRSFSKKSRISSMPSFTWAVRSTPIPNAKPWYSAGSSFTARSTFGWIIPQPSTSVHPLYLHTGHPAPAQSRQ